MAPWWASMIFLVVGKPRPEPQSLEPRELQEVVGQIDEPLTLALQLLHARQGPAFTLRLGILEVLAEELQVEIERVDVVLDLVNEPARELGKGGVIVGL